MSDLRRKRWDSVLSFFLYLLLTVMMTWPIAGQLGTHIPASAGDAWVHMWTFNWVKEALAAGQSPYFTDLLFYPHGVSLLYHNFAWVNIALWLPLQALFGLGAAYSLVFLFVFAFNGFATYLLARELLGARLPAFAAGAVVAFWPHTLSHHNHPNLVFIAWIPLALLYLHRTLEGGRRRDALLAGVFIALIGITRWQQLVMGGFLLGFYLLYRFLADRRVRDPQIVGRLLLAGLLAGLLMVPLLAPVLAGQLTRENPEELFVNEGEGQTDLLAYLLPSRYHPLWGEAVLPLYGEMTINRSFTPFLGYTVLFLAVVAIYYRRKEVRLWLLAALLYIVLALGPELLVNNQPLIPLPYALIEDNFFIKTIRRPDRLNVFLSIPVAIVVAYGLQSLGRHRLLQQRQRLVSGALLFLILAEFIVAYPTFSLATPAWFYELAEEPGDFGLLTIPMHPRALPDKANMYYQFVHGKPLVEGHVSRPPDDAFNFIDTIPFLADLGVNGGVPPENVPDVGLQLRLLREADVRYLIFNKPFLYADELAGWREWLPVAPYHEDDDLLVYRTGLEEGKEYVVQERLLGEAGGATRLGLIGAEVSPETVNQSGWMEVELDWISQTGLEKEYEVCFALAGAGADPTPADCQPLSPSWPTSRWQPGSLVSSSYMLQLDPYIAGGEYSLLVSAREAGGETVGQPVPVVPLQITEFPRTFTAPVPAGAQTFVWEDAIRLHQYALDTTTDSLALTVYWQALRRMDASYKLFVHLKNAETGEIEAQADVVPRDWSYPTYLWEAGEYVEDTIRLDLTEVPAGVYDLSLGLYDEATGERLTAQSEAGETFPDNSVPLAESLEIGD